MCESERWKAKQLHKSFPEVPRIFSDMKALASGRAYDYITEAASSVAKDRGRSFLRIFLQTTQTLTVLYVPLSSFNMCRSTRCWLAIHAQASRDSTRAQPRSEIVRRGRDWASKACLPTWTETSTVSSLSLQRMLRRCRLFAKSSMTNAPSRCRRMPCAREVLWGGARSWIPGSLALLSRGRGHGLCIFGRPPSGHGIIDVCSLTLNVGKFLGPIDNTTDWAGAMCHRWTQP